RRCWANTPPRSCANSAAPPPRRHERKTKQRRISVRSKRLAPLRCAPGGTFMPVGGRVKTELRNQIKELLKEGYTQIAIALELNKAPSTIAHHVRALGVPPRKFFRALPLQDGKRRCDVCHRLKIADLFPSGANPTCTRCTIQQRAAAIKR